MLDHEPLSVAAEAGQILPLYILEPCLWNQPDVSHRHYIHLRHHLSQLEAMFERKRCKLIIKVGDALTILKSLVSKHNIERIYSHYETCLLYTSDAADD